MFFYLGDGGDGDCTWAGHPLSMSIDPRVAGILSQSLEIWEWRRQNKQGAIHFSQTLLRIEKGRSTHFHVCSNTPKNRLKQISIAPVTKQCSTYLSIFLEDTVNTYHMCIQVIPTAHKHVTEWTKNICLIRLLLGRYLRSVGRKTCPKDSDGATTLITTRAPCKLPVNSKHNQQMQCI